MLDLLDYLIDYLRIDLYHIITPSRYYILSSCLCCIKKKPGGDPGLALSKVISWETSTYHQNYVKHIFTLIVFLLSSKLYL